MRVRAGLVSSGPLGGNASPGPYSSASKPGTARASSAAFAPSWSCSWRRSASSACGGSAKPWSASSDSACISPPSRVEPWYWSCLPEATMPRIAVTVG